MSRYTVHSFLAGGSAGSTFDLSDYVATSGIADTNQLNTTWQLTEVEFDSPQEDWSGDVNPDGSLEPGPNTPGDLMFIDLFSCVGHMEIQVEVDDTEECQVPPAPFPNSGSGAPGLGGGGACGAGGCNGGGAIT